MIRVKDIVKQFYPLRYVVDKLAFSTSVGKELFLNTQLITNNLVLEQHYKKIEQALPLLGTKYLQDFKTILSSFRDVHGSIKMLTNGVVLSEVELFELKYLAYNISALKNISRHGGFEIVSLDEIFYILDPCKSKVVNFYIYDVYDSELAALRKRLKENLEIKDKEDIYIAIGRREEIVREQLCSELRPSAKLIACALERVAEIDLIIAQCEFIRSRNLTRPLIGNTVRYEELFNIYLMDIIAEKKGVYQRVDVDLIDAPTLLTGANMSGKTMLLKSIALAQYMVQFGLYAPASYAEVTLFDTIFLSIGDGQQEQEGLSSFAAEMLTVSHIIDKIEEKGKYLVLLDELARTTSPREGAAIVDGVVTLLSQRNVMSLITTHYSSLQTVCRRKRVRGFVEEKIDREVTKENISQFIDYSLRDDTAEENRESEAVRIAEILGVNKLLITETKKLLVSGKKL